MGLHDSIERFAQEMGWVVKYADDGTPNFFYPIYKCKSSDLDASLPEHTHPAFIVNGQEIDRRLIAVFKGSSHNEACHSIPNMPPLVNTGADQLLAKIKACGAGFGPKTCADSGLILLLAKKNGWVPKGNNAYGVDYRDGTSFELNKSVAVGDKRVFRGWEYTALVAHTTSAEHLPSEDVGYWKKGKHVGGTPVASQYSADNSYRGYNTLTGSGPASWRLDGTISGIDDVNSNCFDQDYGYRIYDGELQVLENNNAADPSADLSASSAAWKAILPNSANNGHTLVAPGTSGTLHWTWANSKITLDTVAPTFDSEYRGTSFKDLAVNSANIPYVPALLYELGLFPTPGDTTQGYCYMQFAQGERFPRRGGNYSNTSNAGLGYVSSLSPRSYAGVALGVRGGFLET